ncbi:lipocalin family protein [Paracoccus sp. p4-l81]|uniref:lipocalin family protein n=1 Tax=Paracoccus sp. p4-l81 TaxID=3342806 RepID=UPI0035B7F176
MSARLVTSARLALSAVALGLLAACSTSAPSGIIPVTGFQIDRYLGTWHEIARLDHRFERGMTHVTATYALNPNGTVAVNNQGLKPGCEWDQALGRARFLGDPGTASLGVTFFWPFEGGYHVFALDPDYRWAMISGPDRGYFWLLARDPQMDPALRDRLLAQAEQAGFDRKAMIIVDQGPTDCPAPDAAR